MVCVFSANGKFIVFVMENAKLKCSACYAMLKATPINNMFFFLWKDFTQDYKNKIYTLNDVFNYICKHLCNFCMLS